ncbi:hypothetical protein E3N88_25753 [Mikania micrantha]|uniref:Uncharacterized protein n=1 Tax=Mikania micrantha TaxID=192012 RepID=A0A5N6N5T1_9ASTR|nr:hypothetical protein E3N88_25753 [Mikania micrantha]
MIHNDYKRCASQKSLGPLTGHPIMHSLALAYSRASPEKACKKTKSTQWLHQQSSFESYRYGQLDALRNSVSIHIGTRCDEQLRALSGQQSVPLVRTMKVTLWQALRGRRSIPSSLDYGEHPMASTKRPKQYVLP